MIAENYFPFICPPNFFENESEEEFKLILENNFSKIYSSMTPLERIIEVFLVKTYFLDFKIIELIVREKQRQE